MSIPVNRISARDIAVDSAGRFQPTVLFLINRLVDLVGGREGVLPPAFSFSLADGSVAFPSIFFTDEPGLGFYRSEDGTLSVAAGGQNVANFTANGVNITDIPISSAAFNDNDGNLSGAQLTAGQLLIGNTGGPPTAGNVTGTANRVTVNNGAGTITLSGPQDIAAASSPTFAALTLSGLTPYAFTYPGLLGIISSTTAATSGQLLIGATGGPPVKNNITGTANQITVTNGAGSITLSTPQNIATTSSPTFAALTLTNGFGCNGKTPQAAVAVNGAISGTAGALYTPAEQTLINDLSALVNQLRAALVANGITI